MGFPSSLFIDPTTLSNDGYGLFQVIFLMVVYGVILSYSANLISDGSELLLLIPSLAGVVGSVVLPIIGAAPEGAIMVFSGLGPDAQTQISVGVGALAGSTIMLLTVPWTLVLIAGRVTIDERGRPNYRRKPKLREEGKWSLTGVGVAPYQLVRTNAKFVVLTGLSYFIIQGAAFGAHCDESTGSSNNSTLISSSQSCSERREHWFALAGFVSAMLLMAGYLYYNIQHGDDDCDKEDEVVNPSVSKIFGKELGSIHGLEDVSPLLTPEAPAAQASQLFRKYDLNNDGYIDRAELRMMLIDLSERVDDVSVNELLTGADCHRDDPLNFDQFCAVIENLAKRGSIPQERRNRDDLEDAEDETDDDNDDDKSDDGEEEPSQPQWKILSKSGVMLAIGTLGCLVFSDPMVDCFSELGARLNIKPFYVAFVLAPIASNVQELITSINYAMKKTRKSITLSMVALEGSVCMNNTFCLGIFLALIFFKNLMWEFSAETIAIIFVELAMLLICTFRKVQTLLDTFCILSLFPISLAIVWTLENVVGLN